LTIRSHEGDFNVRPKCARAGGNRDRGRGDHRTQDNRQTIGSPHCSRPWSDRRTAGHIAERTRQRGTAGGLFDPKQILGGPLLCLSEPHRNPESFKHLDHGRVILGEFQRWPEPRTHEHRLDDPSCREFPAKSRMISRALIGKKLVWNIPFNGLGVAAAAGLESTLRGSLPSGRSPRGRDVSRPTDC